MLIFLLLRSSIRSEMYLVIYGLISILKVLYRGPKSLKDCFFESDFLKQFYNVPSVLKKWLY